MSREPRQYVNLFTEEFRPPRWPLAVRQMLRHLGWLLSVLMLVLLSLVVMETWLLVEIRHAETRQQVATEALLKQERRLMPVALDTVLQERVRYLQQEVQLERLRLEYLRNPPLQYTDSFSPLMTALSQHATRSLWLTDVLLLEGGDTLLLAGRVPEPAVVSLYLQGLGELPEFSGRTFRQIRIQRDADNPWLNFELDTRSAEDSAADPRELTSPVLQRRQP